MGKLGDTLRERRTSLGISLQKAEQDIKIRERVLEAIELGDYESLPAPGYVRGYISSYGRYLELDPLPLLAMYKAETGATRRGDRLDLPQVSEAVARSGEQHAVPMRTAAIGLGVLAIIALGIWGVTSLSSGPEPTPPIPLSPTESVEASQQPGTASSESTATNGSDKNAASAGQSTPEASAQTADGEAAPFTVKVTVDADGASWLRVTVDGKKAYEGTLTGGQSKTYEVMDEATIRVGKPEAVTITRDGDPVKVNNNGDIPTVTLTADPAE